MTKGGKTGDRSDFYCPGGHKIRVTDNVLAKDDLRDGTPFQEGEWLVYRLGSFPPP